MKIIVNETGNYNCRFPVNQPFLCQTSDDNWHIVVRDSWDGQLRALSGKLAEFSCAMIPGDLVKRAFSFDLNVTMAQLLDAATVFVLEADDDDEVIPALFPGSNGPAVQVSRVKQEPNWGIRVRGEEQVELCGFAGKHSFVIHEGGSLMASCYTHKCSVNLFSARFFQFVGRTSLFEVVNARHFFVAPAEQVLCYGNKLV